MENEPVSELEADLVAPEQEQEQESEPTPEPEQEQEQQQEQESTPEPEPEPEPTPEPEQEPEPESEPEEQSPYGLIPESLVGAIKSEIQSASSNMLQQHVAKVNDLSDQMSAMQDRLERLANQPSKSQSPFFKAGYSLMQQ